MSPKPKHKTAELHLQIRGKDGFLRVACGAKVSDRHCTRHIAAVTCVACMVVQACELTQEERST